jgi:hypothetical protein
VLYPKILKCFVSLLPTIGDFLISNKMCHSIRQKIYHFVEYYRNHLKLNVKFDFWKILQRDQIRGWWIQSMQTKLKKNRLGKYYPVDLNVRHCRSKYLEPKSIEMTHKIV